MNKTKVFTVRYQIDTFVDWFDYAWLNDEYDWTEDINEALGEEIKIAAVPVFFDQYQQYLKDPFDYKKFDLVLISDVELNHPSVITAWINKLGIKNYLMAYGCMPETLPEYSMYRPWWSFNIIDRNEYHDYTSKPKFDYDVLLGARKYHRDFVMIKMQMSGLIENSIVNYLEVFTAPPEEHNKKFLDYFDNLLHGQEMFYPYYSSNMKPQYEVKDSIDKAVSEIVPWKIYQQTKYSVIAETAYGPTVFITEKTGKCLFAKRIFVMFAGPGYLKLLKNLGFKTFGDIIDESYDDIEDDLARWEAAWKQVETLSNLNYSEVKTIMQPILDHNHHRLIEYRKEIKQQMQQMVYNKIKEIKC